VEADNQGWIPKAIIGSGSSDNDNRKHVFITKWISLPNNENTWESWEHMSNIAHNLIEEYYNKNPSIEKDKRWKIPHHRTTRTRWIYYVKTQTVQNEYGGYFCFLFLFLNTGDRYTHTQ
jgi:hypothetical protein